MCRVAIRQIVNRLDYLNFEPIFLVHAITFTKRDHTRIEVTLTRAYATSSLG